MFRRETISDDTYGPSEMAANGLTLVDVPAGFISTAVTPYDPSASSLPSVATVAHLPNKYCSPYYQALQGFCAISFDNFIVS